MSQDVLATVNLRIYPLLKTTHTNVCESRRLNGYRQLLRSEGTYRKHVLNTNMGSRSVQLFRFFLPSDTLTHY